jgi:hypothetical protein
MSFMEIKFPYVIILSLCLNGCGESTPSAETLSTRSLQSAYRMTADTIFHIPESAVINTPIDSALLSRGIELDSAMKRGILLPIIIADSLPVDEGYATSAYVRCDLIARMKAIGRYIPIVIHAHGDDYNAIYYALIDSGCHTVSHYLLCGAFGTEGPAFIANNFIVRELPRHSLVSGSEIHTYDVTLFIPTDTLRKYSDFDSISYLSHVLPSGHIIPSRVDSFHYRKENDVH